MRERNWRHHQTTVVCLVLWLAEHMAFYGIPGPVSSESKSSLSAQAESESAPLWPCHRGIWQEWWTLHLLVLNLRLLVVLVQLLFVFPSGEERSKARTKGSYNQMFGISIPAWALHRWSFPTDLMRAKVPSALVSKTSSSSCGSACFLFHKCIPDVPLFCTQRQNICAWMRKEKWWWSLVVLDAEILSNVWAKGNLCGSKLGAAGLGRAGITHGSQTWTGRFFFLLSGQWAQDMMLFIFQTSAWIMMMMVVKVMVWIPEIRSVAALRGACRAAVMKIGTWKVKQKSWLGIFASHICMAKLLLVTSSKVPTAPFNPSLSKSHTTKITCTLPVL